MRFGLVVSVAAHAALLVSGLVSLSSARKLEAPPTESIPVDLVSAQELTELKRGSRTGEEKEEAVAAPAPEVSEEPREAPPEEEANPEAETETAEAPPPPAPKPKPEPAPEKAEDPEPVPSREAEAEKKRQAREEAEREAEEAEQEAKEQAKAEAERERERERAEEREEERERERAERRRERERERAEQRERERERERAEEREERRRERERRRARQEREIDPDEQSLEEFDPGEIAALLNKEARPEASARERRRDDERASRGSMRGDSAQLVASELAALAGQVQDCWNPPIGADNPAELQVRLRIVLTPEGSIAGPPRVIRTVPGPFARVAAESAIRAVLQCQPYNISPETFDQLRGGFVFNFDPSDMF